MDNKKAWSDSRDELITALVSLGFPADFGDIVAGYIGSSRGMARMVSYLYQVRPDKVELVVDEMMAIKSDVDRWRDKKESEKANAAYNNILNYRADIFGDD